MKILKTIFIGMVVLALATSAYGEPGKGKGADNGEAKGHEKQAEAQANNGIERQAEAPRHDPQPAVQASRPAQQRIDQPARDVPGPQINRPDVQPRHIAQPSPSVRQTPAGGRNVTAERRGQNAQSNQSGNNRSADNERVNQRAKADRGRSTEHFVNGREEKRAKLLTDLTKALEHARWSYNPHDTRGQGNMGKPTMRDPYGFDKDSGREKSERGRPIWNKETNREKNREMIQRMRKNDIDGDGIKNHHDSDDDNDGVLDTEDIFPLDATESRDFDKDGIGNNADTDDDNDGVLDAEDALPFNSAESKDFDKDGTGDNADLDDDNDGILDSEDALPFNPDESSDFDKDGIGDNADTDDDNDGVLDSMDALPFDPNENKDSDKDGIGNNADTDDDNDGVLDTEDAFPLESTETRDFDQDGTGDNADTDDDNDGVLDAEDVFPLDATETRDFDQDGIGDNADLDDDNNGILDTEKLNLAELMNIDFATDWYFLWLQGIFERYQALIQQDPEDKISAYYVAYYENEINYYNSYITYDRIRVNRGDTIDYTLNLTTPDGFEETKLLVTTSLININDYTAYNSYDIFTGDPIFDQDNTVHYDAGQVIVEQTQEITLGTDDIVSFSYDPVSELAGYNGLYADVVVTVTEPVSGSSYTMTYDRQLYLYRCPYGKVYNAKTGQPVVGAKVTVHFEDGSIVPLDKASNPTAKNPQITDATGRYGVKLETNRKYYITAKAKDYEDYKSEVFTEKWHVLREDIALSPLNEIVSNLNE